MASLAPVETKTERICPMPFRFASPMIASTASSVPLEPE